MNPILIIDDQVDVRMAASIALGQQGFECLEASGPDEALAILSQQTVGLILLDMNFNLDTTSGQEGLHFLQRLKTLNINIPVIVITAWASIDLAVKAMQLGARDFIEKPWSNRQLVRLATQWLGKAQLQSHQDSGSEIIAESAVMQDLLKKAQRAAISDANILITGENGTGKSLLADAIHGFSTRNNERFVSVNMGAIPDTLFESELFGHKKGAFTDAKEDRTGRFEIAGKGTLFLDEIGTLPLALQSKLLRVLESREYEVLGSSETRTTEARIISATNRDLESAIHEQAFRRDLYFRLNTLTLHIPPLRERPDDILPLATHLLAGFALKYQRPALTLSDGARRAMFAHSWPGNVRELSHVLERAAVMSERDEICDADLMMKEGVQDATGELPLLPLDELEKQMIVKAIKRFDGNVIAAGEFLGLSKSAIYRRMEKYGLDTKPRGSD